MITTALWENPNDKFWQQQMEMDLWIPPIRDNCKNTPTQGKGNFRM